MKNVIDALAEKNSITKKLATEIVNDVINGLIEEIKTEEKVRVSGLGTFSKKERAARTGRNPKTAETEELTKNQLCFFKLPFAWTGHSTQGSTINEPYTIDLNCSWINCEWLFTSVTRTTDWSLITFFYSEGQKRMFNHMLRNTMNERLTGYMDQDIKAGRNITNNYIDLKWLEENLVEGSCIYCSEPFDFGNQDEFSVDRIDNDIGHTQDNCQVCCRWCNCVKR